MGLRFLKSGTLHPPHNLGSGTNTVRVLLGWRGMGSGSLTLSGAAPTPGSSLGLSFHQEGAPVWGCCSPVPGSWWGLAWSLLLGPPLAFAMCWKSSQTSSPSTFCLSHFVKRFCPRALSSVLSTWIGHLGPRFAEHTVLPRTVSELGCQGLMTPPGSRALQRFLMCDPRTGVLPCPAELKPSLWKDLSPRLGRASERVPPPTTPHTLAANGQ